MSLEPLSEIRIGGGQSFSVRGYMYTAGYCGSHESAQQCHLYSVLQAADGQMARSAGDVETKDLPGFLVEASGHHVHLTQQAIDMLFRRESA